MADDDDRLLAAARLLPTLPYEAWHFGDSVAFEAMVAAGDVDPSLRAFAHGFARGWEARRETHRETDVTAPGLALCDLFTSTKDPMLLASAIDLAEFLVSRDRVGGVFTTWQRSPLREPSGPGTLPADEAALLDDPGPGVFVDCLHFDPPFFAALWQITGDSRWADVAIEQAEGYVRLLQDTRSGLFHHFYLERTGRTYVPGWGRGQGWALLGLLDVVDRLQHAGVDLTLVRTAAGRVVEAMIRHQRSDGDWESVVVDPDAPVESSTAAFMIAGFTRAADLGVTSHTVVSTAITRARLALASHVDDDGLLHDVTAAVWACTQPSHYRHVDIRSGTPWGQGSLVLALLSGR